MYMLAEVFAAMIRVDADVVDAHEAEAIHEILSTYEDATFIQAKDLQKFEFHILR